MDFIKLTQLKKAIKTDDTNRLSTLLQHDINTYVKTRALKTAIEYNNRIMVYMLLQYGADPNLLVKNWYLLTLALYRGNLGIISDLLGFGADPNRVVDYSPPSLFHVKGVNFGPHLLRVAQLLIDAGANLNARDIRGACLIDRYANVEPDYLLTEYFLKLGVNPNAQDRNGNTPLINASYKDPDIIQLLMAYGADPTILNRYGYTAYDRINDLGPYIDYDRVLNMLRRNINGPAS